MKLAIISDIHANMEAFEAVLEDMDRKPVDSVICLGDTIGYGAEPEQAIEKIIKLNIPSVLGNHELAVNDPTYLQWFNPTVRKSAKITASFLSDRSIDFISRLQPFLENRDCWFVHGFPPDSITTYLFQVPDNRISQVIQKLNRKIIFVGHTHDPALISFDGHKLQHHPFERGITELHREKQYIVNIGSVGQPRDSDNHAKYAIWDSKRHIIELRYVAYDIAEAARKIKAAGLPRQYADRLW